MKHNSQSNLCLVLRSQFAVLLGIVMLALAAGQPLLAQTYTVLHSFTPEVRRDGSNPFASLLRDAGGNLYTTTGRGGAYNLGTIYRLDAAGHGTVLYSFTGGQDGYDPQAGLIRDSAGNLFGVSLLSHDPSCATGSCGAIFQFNLNTRIFTVLHQLNGDTDGAEPQYPLRRDSDGNLYGTARSGGAMSDCGGLGCGNVFKVDSAGSFSVLHTFTSAEGGWPECSLLRNSAGDFYGTLNYYGAHDYGAIFKMDPAGNTTILFSFDGASGGYPVGGLVGDQAGNLYGTTGLGGSGGVGTIYKFDPKKLTYTVLYNFYAGAEGYGSAAPLVRDSAGNLYGTALGGGDLSACPPGGCGTVFKLDPLGNFSVLHAFNKIDGDAPWGPVIVDANGNLYGATGVGGDNDAGVLFEITP